jgi:hypothetical protein
VRCAEVSFIRNLTEIATRSTGHQPAPSRRRDIEFDYGPGSGVVRQGQGPSRAGGARRATREFVTRGCRPAAYPRRLTSSSPTQRTVSCPAIPEATTLGTPQPCSWGSSGLGYRSWWNSTKTLSSAPLAFTRTASRRTCADR